MVRDQLASRKISARTRPFLITKFCTYNFSRIFVSPQGEARAIFFRVLTTFACGEFFRRNGPNFFTRTFQRDMSSQLCTITCVRGFSNCGPLGTYCGRQIAARRKNSQIAAPTEYVQIAALVQLRPLLNTCKLRPSSFVNVLHLPLYFRSIGMYRVPNIMYIFTTLLISR